MSFGQVTERNQDATVYVGSLDEKVNESLLSEIFIQAGPVVNIYMPKDRITQLHQGYGFVEFLNKKDADYAIKTMNMIKLYNKPIKVNKACINQRNIDIGANLFIGNLDNEVDEKLLYDTFAAFGLIIRLPKIMRDPATGTSKGYAFINFGSFEASDAAIEVMDGQHLCNRKITVSYAFKKDSKNIQHGSVAERLLAAQNPISYADRPNQLFADIPHFITVPPPPPPPLFPLPTTFTKPPPPLPLFPLPTTFTKPPPPLPSLLPLTSVPFRTMPPPPPPISPAVGFLVQSENLPTIPAFSTTRTQINQQLPPLIQHPPIFPWQTELQNNNAQLSGFLQPPMYLSSFNGEFFQF